MIHADIFKIIKSKTNVQKKNPNKGLISGA